MLKLILVPLDGSPLGEQALPVALYLAQQQKADLELVHVYEATPPFLTQGAPPIDATLDLELRRRARERLDALAEQLRKTSYVSVKATVLDDPVGSALAEYIEKSHVDLVVMSTHGYGGISRVWIGSVAGDLVRHSLAPVLLIKPKEGAAPMASPRFSRVLIPLDGSPIAEEAIDHTVAVVGTRNVNFLLVHVLPTVGDLSALPLVALPNDEQLQEVAMAYLDGVAKQLASRGISVDYRTLRDSSPARAILEVADESAANLIAMETRGSGGVRRFLMGSTADKVLRGAKVPMLMHRPRVDEKSRAGKKSAGSTASDSGASGSARK